MAEQIVPEEADVVEVPTALEVEHEQENAFLYTQVQAIGHQPVSINVPEQPDEFAQKLEAIVESGKAYMYIPCEGGSMVVLNLSQITAFQLIPVSKGR